MEGYTVPKDEPVRLLGALISELIPTITAMSNYGVTLEMAKLIRTPTPGPYVIRELVRTCDSLIEVMISHRMVQLDPSHWVWHESDTICAQYNRDAANHIGSGAVYVRCVPGACENHLSAMATYQHHGLIPPSLSTLIAFGNTITGPDWSRRMGLSRAKQHIVAYCRDLGGDKYPRIEWDTNSGRWKLGWAMMPMRDTVTDQIWLLGELPR